MPIDVEGDVRAYFHQRLAEAQRQIGATLGDATESYLVDLMSEFALQTPELTRPLYELLHEAAATADAHERLRKLRATGDTALCHAGLFSERLVRRGLSVSYVVAMGQRAYGAAASLAVLGIPRAAEQRPAEVYDELARRFDDVARLMDEVREATELRTPQDIVRLYDRWRRTHSPSAAARLRDAGVFPQASSKTIH